MFNARAFVSQKKLPANFFERRHLLSKASVFVILFQEITARISAAHDLRHIPEA